MPARLACVRHAASVVPEPGSNSPAVPPAIAVAAARSEFGCALQRCVSVCRRPLARRGTAPCTPRARRSGAHAPLSTLSRFPEDTNAARLERRGHRQALRVIASARCCPLGILPCDRSAPVGARPAPRSLAADNRNVTTPSCRCQGPCFVSAQLSVSPSPPGPPVGAGSPPPPVARGWYHILSRLSRLLSRFDSDSVAVVVGPWGLVFAPLLGSGWKYSCPPPPCQGYSRAS